MSFSKLFNVFSALKKPNSWSLYLININKPERGGAVTYLAHSISLRPQEALLGFVGEIADKFWQPERRINRGKLNEFSDVSDYDGTAEAKKIYRISTDHELIQEDVRKLKYAMADVDVDNEWSFFESAYVIRGGIPIDDEETDVMLISARKPVTVLNNKYSLRGDIFQEIKEKVLSLTPMIDLILVGQLVYFFTSEAEKLFDLERSYRKTCDRKVTRILECNIVNSAELFKTYAKKGFNPRRFVTFSQSKLESLMLREMRISVSSTFGIPLEEGGDRFDISDPKNADKLVKILCNKGMIDAFDQRAVEVSSAKKWE